MSELVIENLEIHVVGEEYDKVHSYTIVRFLSHIGIADCVDYIEFDKGTATLHFTKLPMYTEMVKFVSLFEEYMIEYHLTVTTDDPQTYEQVEGDRKEYVRLISACAANYLELED